MLVYRCVAYLWMHAARNLFMETSSVKVYGRMCSLS